MATLTQVTPEGDLDERIKADLAKIDFTMATTVHLADLIRVGSKSTQQSYDWGEGERACALAAASLAARSMDLI